MKLVLVLVALGLGLSLNAQVDSDERDLRKRLDAYMEHTHKKNFDKLMDYMHPSLFDLAPRALLVQTLNETFSAKEVAIGYDSLAITAISPDFLHNNSQYRKVEYYFIMAMKFTDKDIAEDTSLTEQIIDGLKEDFGDGEIIYDKKRAVYIIKASDILLAIKDPGKEWLFLGYESDNKLLQKLYPVEVRKHFKLD